jgi:uncharacterized protein
MLIDLRDIMQRPGAGKSFAFDLDLSDMEFYGICPISEPIHVEGEVNNHAGLLMMTGSAETTLHVNCDRCGKPFLKPMSIAFEHMLADHLEDEENDEIILLKAGVLDAGDAVTDDIVYGMDSSNLCKEDCKGRCFRCGKDLNEGECDCKPELDPRMAVLAKLLEKQD